MGVKLIAIGSRLMGDDGAAIEVTEQLWDALDRQDIQVIIGETDAEYCLSSICDNDSIIILDAALSGRKPGSVWSLELSEALEEAAYGSYQHDMDLIGHIKAKKINVSGILIGIEAYDVGLRFGLSPELQVQLSDICKAVQKIINEYRGEQ